MRSYRQFCGLARALDHVGDRWTLLVVRELLLGASTYGELSSALPGIPSNLLALRLRDLERDALVERVPDERDRRRLRYALTESGNDLRPVLHALVRWGGRWMATGPGGDAFEPRWAQLAVRALLEGRQAAANAVIVLDLDGADPLTARGDRRGAVRVDDGRHADPDATITGPIPELLAVLDGRRRLAARRVNGNVAAARAVVEPAVSRGARSR